MSAEVCSSDCIWMNVALLTLVSLLQTDFLLAFGVNTQFDGGYILLKEKVKGLSVLLLFHILLRIKIIIIHFETVLRWYFSCYRSVPSFTWLCEVSTAVRGLRVSLVFNHGRYYLLGPSGTKWLHCQSLSPLGFQFTCYFLMLFSSS